MISLKNLIKTFFRNLFNKLKGGQLAIDELSLFLITTALITVFLLMFLNLHRFVFFAWLPILMAYWRSLTKNTAKRTKENQIFIKYYYPIHSFFKNTYRYLTVQKEHIYFNCKKCTQQLRMPKKTGHIKVTCPKCNHSFIRKNIRGYLNKLKKKVA